MSKKKLYFRRDAIMNGKLLYEKGKIHEVPEEKGFAMRWLKRGAVTVDQMTDKEKEKCGIKVDKKASKKEKKAEDESKSKKSDSKEKGKAKDSKKDDVAKKDEKKED